MEIRRFWEKVTGSADMRFALKSGFKQLLLVLAVGLLAKFFVCDSLKIAGPQMEPAIRAGDRVLLFKLPYRMPIVKNFFKRPGTNNPVIAILPDQSAVTALRIAAVSGDTVSVHNAQFYRNGYPIEQFHRETETYGAIPAAYSPADFMDKFKIPAPGDSVAFSDLTQRDLIFAYSIFRQEKKGVSLKAFVWDTESETASADYLIEDFALYNGRIDTIPEVLHGDWFFWDRLQEYLNMITAKTGTGAATGIITSAETEANGEAETDTVTDAGANGKRLRLAFSIFRNGREVSGFKVKKRHVFLIGDNWAGAKDSRYFGPVIGANIEGRVIMTFWGFEENEEGKRRLDARRIGRLVR